MQYLNSNSEVDRLFRNFVLNGNQESFQKLFVIFFPRLNDFAFKIVGDLDISQDIVQDTFVKVWEKRKEYKYINVEAFFFRMVRNRCIDYLRHLKVVNNAQQELNLSAHVEELYRIDFLGNEPYLLIEEELQIEIESVINSLPDRCREVFVLSRMEGLKNVEIALKLGINIKNVERHIRRALLAFKSRFGDSVDMAILIIVLHHMTS